MRILVTGDAKWADELRSALRRAGFSMVSSGPRDLVFHAVEEDSVFVDGVDGPFEAAVVRHICDPNATDPKALREVTLRRIDGVMHDREIKIGCPPIEEVYMAVVRGCLRAALDFAGRPETKRSWWRRSLWLLLLAALPQVACAATTDRRLDVIEARLANLDRPDFAKALALRCMGERLALDVYMASWPLMRSSDRLEFMAALELSTCSPEAIEYRRAQTHSQPAPAPSPKGTPQ